MKWILASASPRRLEILRANGIDPDVKPARIPEIPIPGESGKTYALRLAREKALTIATTLPQVSETTRILAADTVVLLDDAILEKPADAAHATAMLKRLSGRTHQVLTAFCVITLPDCKEILDCVVTHVTFRSLTDEQIRAYVASGDPFDKAGAYGIQTVRDSFVEKIEGSLSNVVGLPWDKIADACI